MLEPVDAFHLGHVNGLLEGNFDNDALNFARSHTILFQPWLDLVDAVHTMGGYAHLSAMRDHYHAWIKKTYPGYLLVE